MLVDNTENQVALLDNKLQADLTGVQLKVWELIDDEKLTVYEADAQATSSVTTKLRLDADIKDMLKSDVTASSTIGQLDVYWPNEKKMISTSITEISLDGENKPLVMRPSQHTGWRLLKNQGFFYIDSSPFSNIRRENIGADFVIGAKVKKDYVTSFLYSYDTSDYVKVALMDDNGVLLSKDPIDSEIRDSVRHSTNAARKRNYELNVPSGKYRVIMQRNRLSGIWLITYFNVNKAMTQYHQVDILTTELLLLLLGLAVVVSIIFYRNFYANLERLIHRFRRVEQGDYSARMDTDSSGTTEFSYLFRQFNNMLHNTEDLIDQLKSETQLRETAEFKQLQAQINPHFLYNNLLFIMSMAKTSPDAVIKMTQHLSAYYRYMTKQYSTDVTLEQECDLAEHYLTILSLRKSIDFTIKLPAMFKREPIIVLVLQPLIENAIKHGLEQRIGAHVVIVKIQAIAGGYTVSVTDDGKGMTPTELVKLSDSLHEREASVQHGIGLWNVNWRLINRYGMNSSLRFKQNDYGGLTVSFFVPRGGYHESIDR